MDIVPGKDIPTSAHYTKYGDGLKRMFDEIRAPFPVFAHHHPPIENVNDMHNEQLSMGDRIADRVASTVGSWPFISIQSVVLATWIFLNIAGWVYRWDPYPFILLNLVLSFQAAYAAPFVMMSQNRQAAKDRLMAESDYVCNIKGEEEIRHVMEHLDHQDKLILEILQHIETQHQDILHRLASINPDQAKQFIDEMKQIEEDY